MARCVDKTGTYGKRILMLLITVFFLSLFLWLPENAADRTGNSEPHSTMDSAIEINVNESASGFLEAWNDQDWYKVSVPEDGFITLQFEHAPLSSDINYWKVSLYQSDGTTPVCGEDIHWVVSGDRNMETSQIGLSAGTYYIKVESYFFFLYDKTPYTIQAAYSPSDFWESEANGSEETANPIALNSYRFGSVSAPEDEDWYAVTLPEDGTLSIRFFHPALQKEKACWDMYLYLPDEEEMSWELLDNASRILQEDFPMGTYYIKIQPHSSQQYDSCVYTLSVQFDAPAYAVTEQEDNNSMDSATVMEIIQNVCGSIGAVDDTDWYRLSVPEDGTVMFDFQHPFIQSDDLYWKMSILHADGKTNLFGQDVYWVIAGNGILSTDQIGLSAGTYYIKVEPYSADSYTSSDYTLRVNYLPSPLWEKENNNTVSTANTIPVNSVCYGSVPSDFDADWYAVTLPEDGNLTLNFSPPFPRSEENYLNIQLYQSNGTTPVYGEDACWKISGTTQQEIPPTGLPAGTYYIKIEPCPSYQPLNQYATYTLQVKFITDEDAEQECNNTMKAATALEVNQSVSGCLGHVNDVDWYKVSVPEDGCVVFRFEHSPLFSNEDYWNVSVFKSDGTTGIYGEDTCWTVRGDRNMATAEMGLSAGTYYIKVEPCSPDRYTPFTYTLWADHIPSDFWETENNNTLKTADKLQPNSFRCGSVAMASDIDWYSVKIPKNGSLSFRFSHPSLSRDDCCWNLYLYQPDGTTQIHADKKGMSMTVDAETGEIVSLFWAIPGNENLTTGEMGLSAGTYYVKIEPLSYEQYDTASYTLEALYTPSDRIETESNDTAEDADSISLGSVRFGSICGWPDSDWYVWNLKSKTAVLPVLRSNEKNLKLTLYSRDGVSVLSEMSSGDAPVSEMSDVGELSAGRYYIQIQSGDKGSYTDDHYQLTLSKAHEHVFTYWIPDTKAICDSDRTKKHTCELCGYFETAPLPSLPHSFAEGVRISGNLIIAPIVYHETCTDCGYVQVIEDYQYDWVLPTLILSCILLVAFICAFTAYRRDKLIFGTYFVCPYCSGKHTISEVQFRCSNSRCRDVPDMELTRYENGNTKTPILGKPVFSVKNPERGRKLTPKLAPCPKCRKKTPYTVCPSCHNRLPQSTLLSRDKVRRDIVISVIGPSDAGKSHFVGVLIHELLTLCGSATMFNGSGTHYERSFRHRLYQDLKKLDLTLSSLENPDNGAYRPIFLSEANSFFPLTFSFVFFDTSGIDLNDADTMNTVNRHISNSSGIIFLLDPMKLSAVTAQLDYRTIRGASSLRETQVARPEDILTRVSNMIRNDRGLKSSEKIDIPVAVVCSKLDAIASVIPKNSAILNNSPHRKEQAFVLSDGQQVDAEVQKLLRDWGAETFLSQLDINYKNFSCFAVSSLGMGNNPDPDQTIKTPAPHRIEDPLLWILMKLKKFKRKK